MAKYGEKQVCSAVERPESVMSCKECEPTMTFRMKLAQVVREPSRGCGMQQGETGLKVEFILGTKVARFIEQLHLDLHTGDAMIGHDQIIVPSTNQVAPSAEPRIAFGFG